MNLSFNPPVEMYGPVLLGPGAYKTHTPYQLKRLTSSEKEAVNKAKKYAMEQNIRTVLLKQTRQHEVQQMINVKRGQAMVLLSRIYVGSINYDVKEDTIRQAFNCFGPVKNVSLSYDPITQKHMGYAFLEFEFPEGAQLALNQNTETGINISGRQCKVGRPTNMPHSGPLVDELYAEANKYPRIYIANVHPNLSSDDLKSVFEAFGPIESCQLQPDLTKNNTKQHRGFGFIEYQTHQAAHEAMSAMNMFDLGGQLLRVARAITPANLITMPTATANAVGALSTSQMPAAAAVAAASITAQVQALEVQQVAGVTQDIKLTSSNNSENVPVIDSTKADASVSRSKRKFSENKMATDDNVGTPSLVIPNKISRLDKSPSRERSRSGSNANSVKEGQTERLMSQMESLKSSTLTDHINTEEEATAVYSENRLESLDTDNVKIRGSQARTQMMQKLWRATEEKTMVMKNMIDQSDLDDSFESEVSDECAKFGDVLHIRIIVDECEDSQDDNGQNEGEVKIFVVFATTEAMAEAVRNMNGRYFGGRIVEACQYDQELFDAGDYSG